MKERPILFSAPMVRALLDGSKTQTRRVAKLTDAAHVKEPRGHRHWHPADPEAKLACPYGQPGDQLWVRESFQYRGASYDGRPVEESEWFRCYGQGGASDNWDPNYPQGWEPSRHMKVRALTGPGEQEDEGTTGWVTKRIPGIHMPRWASRITLEIVSVSLERLQEISEADALAEGIKPLQDAGAVFAPAKSAYCDLWESINGIGTWFSNPWVWVVEFRRIEA